MFAEIYQGSIKSVHHGDTPPEGNYIPVVKVKPSFNPDTQFIKEKPRSQWIVGESEVQITFEVIEKELEVEKEKAIGLIKQYRDQAIYQGVSVNVGGEPKRFHGDDTTVSRVNQSVVDANQRPNNFEKRWRLDNGEWITIDAPTMIQIHAKGADHLEACFRHQESLEIQVNNATSVSDLVQIDVESGWPVN